MIPSWAISIAGFVLAAASVGLVLRYARARGVVDVPNQRSSHTTPTPRGGGIGLVLSVVVLAAYLISDAQVDGTVQWLVLAAAVAALALVGWLDDHRPVPVSTRFPIHVFCGLALAALVNIVAPLPGPLNLLWLALWAFWTVASINIVNFMDGIDGMIAAQGVVYGVFLYLLIPGETFGGQLALLLAASCAGFLVWNWAPAKIFMGDVGSGPLGAFIVTCGAIALTTERWTLVFLPLFPLYLDSLITIVIRHRRGEKLTDAHRLHLYQRVANGGVGHARVTLAYAALAALGAIVALSVRTTPMLTVVIAISIYAMTVAGVWVAVSARFPLVRRS